jgi:hypothetical protein
MVTGIVLVSIWMAISLLFSFFLIPFGGDAACLEAADPERCRGTFTSLWVGLLLVELAATVVAIVLWTRPRMRTRVWGLVIGVVGTGVIALVFVGLKDIAL